MWGKTLPQFLELQEACLMRDGIIEAAHKDAEAESKSKSNRG